MLAAPEGMIAELYQIGVSISVTEKTMQDGAAVPFATPMSNPAHPD